MDKKMGSVYVLKNATSFHARRPVLMELGLNPGRLVGSDPSLLA